MTIIYNSLHNYKKEYCEKNILFFSFFFFTKMIWAPFNSDSWVQTLKQAIDQASEGGKDFLYHFFTWCKILSSRRSHAGVISSSFSVGVENISQSTLCPVQEMCNNRPGRGVKEGLPQSVPNTQEKSIKIFFSVSVTNLSCNPKLYTVLDMTKNTAKGV